MLKGTPTPRWAVAQALPKGGRAIADAIDLKVFR